MSTATPPPSKPKSLGDILQEFASHRQLMQQELQKVIVGQHEVIEQLFAAIFTRGHCLLEGMQEREVSVGRQTYELPDPFFTIATQNPIEQEGTYPLPEAQLDRFMFNIKVGYPTSEEEEKILAQTTRTEKVEVRKILSSRAIVNLQKLVHSVAVSEYIVKYVARLVRATRPKDDTAPEFVKELVDWGAGPRAGQNLINGGKALAAMDGRFSVAIDDIKKIAVPVLRHRLSTNFQAQAEGMTTEDVILRLLKEVKEPEVSKFA